VVIAVTVMRMVKVAVHHVVDMISMGNRIMAAVCAMLVLSAMCSAVVTACAVSWIRGADLQVVLVDVAFVQRVQVAVMDVIGVPVVKDRCMTTVRAVLVRVVLMNVVLVSHWQFSF
jgi:hypothetical protein